MTAVADQALLDRLASAGPYKGLAPFDDSDLDALLFFGRDLEREVIEANLFASRLTVLYGQTGVGKSSLLRAGLVHALRQRAERNHAARGHPEFAVVLFDRWQGDASLDLIRATHGALADLFGDEVVEPPRDEAIADALDRWTRELDCDVLLVLDQAEELFLYDARGAFAEQLPEIVNRPLRANMLLSLREDQLAKLDRFKGRIRNLFANYLRVDHLDPKAARDAIEEPLRRYSALTNETVTIEPELVEAILEQTLAGKVDLGRVSETAVAAPSRSVRVEAPYLQLVLQRLWEAERAAGSDTLRLETLLALGGAEEIARTHLERALAGLDEAGRGVAASVFLHLVTPSGTKIAHAVGDLAEYTGTTPDELEPVLRLLAQERIVRPVQTPGHESANGSYEIFHDVLGEAVLAWRARYAADLALAAERRRRKRAFAVASAALLALAGVTAIALFAIYQRTEAKQQERSARGRELIARSLVARDLNPEQSLALAVAAARQVRTPEVEDVLRLALGNARERRVYRSAPGARFVAFDQRDRLVVPAADGLDLYDAAGRRAGRLPLSATSVTALSEDGRLALTREGTQVIVRDAATGDPLEPLVHQGKVRTAEFDPTGRLVASVGLNRVGREQARLFRVRDGKLLHVFPARGIKSVAFSNDSTLLATGSADGSARVYRLRDRRLLDTFGGHNGHVLAVAFSPNSKLLATGAGDSGVRIFDLATHDRLFQFVGHNNPTVDVAWSPDSGLVTDASLDKSARTYDVGGIGAGRIAAYLVGHAGAVVGVAYSHDGRRVATVSSDGTTRVWEARVEEQLQLVSRHSPGQTTASFDRAGRLIAVAAPDGAVVVDPQKRTTTRLSMLGPVSDARFDPNGRIVAGGRTGAAVFAARGRRLFGLMRAPVVDVAVSRGGRIAVASANAVRIFAPDGRPIARLDGPAGPVVFSSGGALAIGAPDGSVRLWRSGRTPLVLTGHSGPVTALAFSPDGRTLASASVDGTAALWDGRTGAYESPLDRGVTAVNDVTFSPDGKRVLTANADNDSRLWDARSGQLLHRLRGHFFAVNSASFSSDGRWIVTTSAISAALWIASTGHLFAYLRGHLGPVRSAEFSPTGRRVVTASDDGTVRVYECQVCGGINDLVALARTRLAAR